MVVIHFDNGKKLRYGAVEKKPRRIEIVNVSPEGKSAKALIVEE